MPWHSRKRRRHGFVWRLIRTKQHVARHARAWLGTKRGRGGIYGSYSRASLLSANVVVPQAKEAAAQTLMDKLRDEAEKERVSQQREREMLRKFQQKEVRHFGVRLFLYLLLHVRSMRNHKTLVHGTPARHSALV